MRTMNRTTTALLFSLLISGIGAAALEAQDWRTVTRSRQVESEQHMDVEIRDRLSSVVPGVDDAAEAGSLDAFEDSHFAGSQKQVSEALHVLVAGVLEASKTLSRNDEYVHGRLWLHVAEGDAVLVFIDDVRRDLAT